MFFAYIMNKSLTIVNERVHYFCFVINLFEYSACQIPLGPSRVTTCVSGSYPNMPIAN